MDQKSLSHFIWSVADLLRGAFKHARYGQIILPFTLIQRLDCVSAPSKIAVLVEADLGRSDPFRLSAALTCKVDVRGAIAAVPVMEVV